MMLITKILMLRSEHQNFAGEHLDYVDFGFVIILENQDSLMIL